MRYAGRRAKLSEKNKAGKVWNLLLMTPAFQKSSGLVKLARSGVLTRLELSKKYILEGTPSKLWMRG